MIYKNKKHICLALSALLVSSMGLVGCSDSGGSSSSAENPPAVTTTTVSGVAVDGYLAGSIVTLNGVSTTTGSDGQWSLQHSGNINDVVSLSGGVDTSTGKAFEGTLNAQLGADGVQVAVTPLSTLVSSLVQSGSSYAAASAKIASQLGISEATLTADPIALLATGSAAQKAEAASAIKSMLVVQKAAEACAKSMGSVGSANYEATFAGMYDVIAAQLNSATPSAAAFDTVMANTAAITSALQTQLAATVTDPLLDERLQAASESVASIVSSIQSISVESFQNNTDATAKAVEQLTTLIENQLADIATATDIATIGAAQDEAGVVAEQNTIANLVNDYIQNPGLDIVDTTPPVVDPVVPPVVDPVTPPATTKTVAVTAAGTNDASSLASTYNFTAGTYAYTITGFNDGDVLNFPDTNTPTIINTSFSDTALIVQWAYDGRVITVNLSGIPTADDANIYGTTSFKTAFGTSSIQ